MSAIIKATNLCKTYSNESVQQHVLKNLNLEISEGDFTVIMGRSGSGKSTLLYALSGMDRPTLGEIRFQDEKISDYTEDQLALFRRQHCGFIFQQNYLNDSMSVMDNVIICGLLKTKNKKTLKKRAEKLFARVNIDKLSWNKFPTQLSGGEQQRVSMVRGVINEPDIIFADEPTGALNSQNSTQVLDILTELNEVGQTILMVTHDLKSAKRANRILYLQDGGILGELRLPAYQIDDNEQTHQITQFLSEMGW